MEEPLGEGEIALNLGCGLIRWPGWVNVDLHGDPDVRSDLRELDFPSNHADRIAAIHVFEHFYRWEVQAMLVEWKRVLKPGGRLVLEMPDLTRILGHIIARLNKNQAPAAFMSWNALWGDPREKNPAMCHRWAYTEFDVYGELERAGFVDVFRTEARYHFPIRDMRIEAFKPSTT